jgi:hypothetical protein
MIDLTKTIEELESTLPELSEVERGLMTTAIHNIKRVKSRTFKGLRNNYDPRDFTDVPCPECQPGRPCYGHGHY